MTTAPENYPELDEYLDHLEQPDDYHSPEVDQYPREPDGGPQGPWSVQNDGAADWALRKLAKVKAKRAEVHQLADERLANIHRWSHEVDAPLIADEARWNFLLSDYALRRREETGEKSVKLPNGTLGTTLHNQGGAVEITAKAELLAWLATYHDLEDRWCKIDPEPQVSRIKPEVFIESGAICGNCGEPIVLIPESHEAEAGAFSATLAHWVSSVGAACPAEPPAVEFTGWRHQPIHDGDGEIMAVQVVMTTLPLLGRVPVPGLGVRAESVTPKVEPS